MTIVRISGEGQYRLPDSTLERLNRLDNEAVAAAESGQQERFGELFGEMIELVRGEGKQLAPDDLSSSDVILPPADTDLDEVRAEFTGEGLIPG